MERARGLREIEQHMAVHELFTRATWDFSHDATPENEQRFLEARADDEASRKALAEKWKDLPAGTVNELWRQVRKREGDLTIRVAVEHGWDEVLCRRVAGVAHTVAEGRRPQSAERRQKNRGERER